LPQEQLNSDTPDTQQLAPPESELEPQAPAKINAKSPTNAIPSRLIRSF
jgi:hypothetical protein